MAGILIDVPDEIWQRAQQFYGVKNPRTQVKMLVDQCAWDAFKQTVPWANGKTPVQQQRVADTWAAAPEEEKRLDAELTALLGNKIKQMIDDPKPTEPPKPVELLKSTETPYWTSDAHLAGDIHRARARFKADCRKFWRVEFFSNGMQPERSVEGVEDFLEDIEKDEYAELTEPMQNFLNLIRKVHRNWWKATHKPAAG